MLHCGLGYCRMARLLRSRVTARVLPRTSAAANAKRILFAVTLVTSAICSSDGPLCLSLLFDLSLSSTMPVHTRHSRHVNRGVSKFRVICDLSSVCFTFDSRHTGSHSGQHRLCGCRLDHSCPLLHATLSLLDHASRGLQALREVGAAHRHEDTFSCVQTAKSRAGNPGCQLHLSKDTSCIASESSSPVRRMAAAVSGSSFSSVCINCRAALAVLRIS